ncbi:MAG TPA: wax ester/triacylglycerol synthase family O-acyltransferase [Acidimicrobiia bacterium]|nr:wax ester/triacylglycerol synthase family O-acyltransferase [Acidimicrobiia bacterium]
MSAPRESTDPANPPSEQFVVHMSDADALMWNIEKDPMLRSTITAIAVLDRAPDWDRLVGVIDRATRMIPQLRQRVVVPPLRVGPPRWTFDANFDLEYHLRRVRAPEPATLDTLLHIAEGIGMAGFDRARPLWEFVLVEGLGLGEPTASGGRSKRRDGAALIQKVHHSITDGVGGIRLAMHLLDLEPDPPDREPAPDAPPAEEPSLLDLIAEAAAHNQRRARNAVARSTVGLTGAALSAFSAPDAAVARAIRSARSVARILAPVNEPLSPIMRGRSLSSRYAAVSVGLDELKAAAKAVDGTLNDAFVAAVGGGLRRYHEAHGAAIDDLRMTMPINIRVEDDPTAGNRFVPARFPVPVAIVDPVERMRQVGRLVREWRSEPALALTDTLAGILNRLPTSVTTRVFGGMLKGVDFVTSNVPGVPFPVYLAGSEVTAQYAFGPLSGAATNLVLVSHCGTCYVGVNVDASAIPDRDRFVACIQAGFDEVVAVGTA